MLQRHLGYYIGLSIPGGPAGADQYGQHPLVRYPTDRGR